MKRTYDTDPDYSNTDYEELLDEGKYRLVEALPLSMYQKQNGWSDTRDRDQRKRCFQWPFGKPLPQVGEIIIIENIGSGDLYRYSDEEAEFDILDHGKIHDVVETDEAVVTGYVISSYMEDAPQALCRLFELDREELRMRLLRNHYDEGESPLERSRQRLAPTAQCFWIAAFLFAAIAWVVPFSAGRSLGTDLAFQVFFALVGMVVFAGIPATVGAALSARLRAIQRRTDRELGLSRR